MPDGNGAARPSRPPARTAVRRRFQTYRGVFDHAIRTSGLTAGSSGGGWFRETSGGKLALVSNTSIGPAGSAGWLAGPQLGAGAQQVFDTMSEKYGSR